MGWRWANGCATNEWVMTDNVHFVFESYHLSPFILSVVNSFRSSRIALPPPKFCFTIFNQNSVVRNRIALLEMHDAVICLIVLFKDKYSFSFSLFFGNFSHIHRLSPCWYTQRTTHSSDMSVWKQTVWLKLSWLNYHINQIDEESGRISDPQSPEMLMHCWKRHSRHLAQYNNISTTSKATFIITGASLKFVSWAGRKISPPQNPSTSVPTTLLCFHQLGTCEPVLITNDPRSSVKYNETL